MTHKQKPVTLSAEDIAILDGLRGKSPAQQRIHESPKSTGQKVADAVASVVGSWRFIIIQSALLALWIVLNVIGWIKAWDPYPF
ncbi:MAG: DUF1003 domain-containing protein, partial [Alphaproteobacteria bacterium]|nr:DUF1003 domain-containing protein [Alphaproteobacteria bacterium]